MAEENQNFFQKVYEVARLIPYGRVTSYGAIAKYLGAARSARMVGWAMNASHNEGVQVRELQIIDFEKHFWDPNKELGEYYQ